MTSREWAFLACRILSLYALFWAIEYCTFFGFEFFQMLAGIDTPFHYVSSAILFVLFSVLFLFFWFGASWLSQKMMPREVDATVPGDWNIELIMSLIISVLGLILVVNAIPSLAGIVAAYILGDTPFPVEITVEVTAKVVMGMALLVGSRAIAKAVRHLRGWST